MADLPVTAVGASTQLSTLLPATCKRALLQARGGALHFRFDGTAAAAGTSALTLADGATFDLNMESIAAMALVRVIGTNISGAALG